MRLRKASSYSTHDDPLASPPIGQRRESASGYFRNTVPAPANEEPFCCPTGWKVTLVGSRFTHAAESRYAPVEGEALAVADALSKARYFVLGCEDLMIAVDHKPLLKLFGDRSLEDIPNPRLRNLKEKTLQYRFRMVHIPGIKHRAADSVSQHPTGDVVRMTLTDNVASLCPSPCLIPDSLKGIRSPAP
jgi:hypothetical protein